MMQKNIDFISMDVTLIEWLCENLKRAPAGSEELLASLTKLQHGNAASLMLEVDETGTPPSSVREDETLHCGDLEIAIKSRKVKRGKTNISLTPKEFDILCFLARSQGEVFTKEQIYRAVWGDEYWFDDSNIMAFIRKLRQKIEPDPAAPQYILTVWGVGYQFSDAV